MLFAWFELFNLIIRFVCLLFDLRLRGIWLGLLSLDCLIAVYETCICLVVTISLLVELFGIGDLIAMV